MWVEVSGGRARLERVTGSCVGPPVKLPWPIGSGERRPEQLRDKQRARYPEIFSAPPRRRVEDGLDAEIELCVLGRVRSAVAGDHVVRLTVELAWRDRHGSELVVGDRGAGGLRAGVELGADL